MSRSARLLAATADARAAATDVRFVREVATGTLTETAWAAYLEIEEGFVETAMRLHGTALADAPSWGSACRHARAAQALATEQADFFVAARAACSAVSALTGAGRTGATTLSTVTRDVSRRGGHAGVVTALFAAETLYRQWCGEVDLPAPGPVRDWVALHRAPDFLAGVDALAAEVDDLSPDVDDAQLEHWYREVLAAEIAFHDAVYR